MKPTAKSLILDLLQSLRGRALPVRALVEAGALFGLRENAVRVALARLLERGTVEREQAGQYRLPAERQALSRHIARWSEREGRTVAWTGAWVGVLGAGLARSERSARRRDARALALLGFAELAPSLWVRPDNLRGGVAATRAELHELGLAREAAVVGLSELEAELDARARELFDGEARTRSLRAARVSVERGLARLPELARESAMVESFRVGGRAIRELVLDPCLPDALAPESERRALLAAMRAYDRAGRAAWREFLRSHDAFSANLPVSSAGLSANHPALASVA